MTEVTRYSLADGMYIHPTPGGAYHAFSTPSRTPAQRLIRGLLQSEVTPALTLDNLQLWSGLDDAEQALALLHHSQGVHWVQGFRSERHCPEGTIERIAPALLAGLGHQGKVLLADSQGFYLASSGFNHEVAEELSALCAELAILHDRRSGLLLNNMGLNSSAWAVVGAFGNSRLGFWPIHIGDSRFVLVIGGMPRLNQPDFVKLIWILNLRYSAAPLPVAEIIDIQ
jgi:hypothetical protein